jgi:hypothetical protein
MNTLMITDHAVARLAQRGIKLTDAQLITLIGTPVDDGYLVRARDCQEIENSLKKLLERVRRARGKRLVVSNGRIVTGYHASGRYQRRMLQKVHESDM